MLRMHKVLGRQEAEEMFGRGSVPMLAIDAMTKVRITVMNLKTEPINVKGHWSVKAKKTKIIRETVYLHVLGSKARRRGLPVSVRITRLSAGELDFLAVGEALKACVDGLADGLGLPDDKKLQMPERMTLAQETCKRGTFGIRIDLVFEL